VRVSADGIATHRNWSGLLVGTKLGTVDTDSKHPKTPTRSRYFYPCADIFSEFSEPHGHPRLDRQIEVLSEHSKTGKEGNAQETGESRKGRI
jgi:hypothetical protein